MIDCTLVQINLHFRNCRFIRTGEDAGARQDVPGTERDLVLGNYVSRPDAAEKVASEMAEQVREIILAELMLRLSGLNKN